VDHSVSIDSAVDASGAPCFVVKLQAAECEVNVTVPATEISKLRGVGETRWLDRKCLQLGECLGAPAFWSSEDGRLSVLIGPDRASWTVGIFLPQSAVDELFEEMERASATHE
jgi:hypothetical protein